MCTQLLSKIIETYLGTSSKWLIVSSSGEGKTGMESGVQRSPNYHPNILFKDTEAMAAFLRFNSNTCDHNLFYIYFILLHVILNSHTLKSTENIHVALCTPRVILLSFCFPYAIIALSNASRRKYTDDPFSLFRLHHSTLPHFIMSHEFVSRAVHIQCN